MSSTDIDHHDDIHRTDDASCPAFRILRDFMADERFIAIQRRSMDRPLLWSEFDTMEMPRGLTAEQTWELLGMMRHQTAVWLPYENDDGKTGWYSITHATMEDFNAIDRYCSPDSWLALTLSSRNMVYSLIDQLVRETVTVLRYDGVTVERDQARMILLGERHAESPAEKAVENIRSLIWGPDSVKGQAVDADFIDEVHSRISDRCDCPMNDMRALSETTMWKKRSMEPHDALRLVVDMANNVGVDPAQHPLLVAQGIDSIFRLCEPLASFNTVVSWFVRRSYFMANKLPVLAQVSILNLEDEWNRGIRKPRTLRIDFEDSIVSYADSVDFTAYAAGFVCIVKDELERIDNDLHRTVDSCTAFEEAIQHDPEINYRQRSILLRALEDPAAIFRIGAHQMAFNITYATARTDLLKLEDQGFLDRVNDGRAFVFRPKPDFERIVDERWPSASE